MTEKRKLILLIFRTLPFTNNFACYMAFCPRKKIRMLDFSKLYDILILRIIKIPMSPCEPNKTFHSLRHSNYSYHPGSLKWRISYLLEKYVIFSSFFLKQYNNFHLQLWGGILLFGDCFKFRGKKVIFKHKKYRCSPKNV